METSPLPVKSPNFRSMCDTYGLWGRRDLYLDTPAMAQGLVLCELVMVRRTAQLVASYRHQGAILTAVYFIVSRWQLLHAYTLEVQLVELCMLEYLDIVICS
jgi:hypothetical protein